jgi:hypothetical protein
VEELLLLVINVHRVDDVRQIEMHIVCPLVPGVDSFVVEIAIAKTKSMNYQVVIRTRQNLLKQE